MRVEAESKRGHREIRWKGPKKKKKKKEACKVGGRVGVKFQRYILCYHLVYNHAKM